ncbi:sugar phosphate isomerase/epimerase family protein [Sediminispirochaeta smaragdinae]|uniref:Xylose isomerase domain protein TIM barrel n=1 Tax=Sediminispirochaeta smaragdinae (strain DSM 11293 / JCM 15392 / SEBR 4228) TaxID=573413 RepID=E1RC04_SEDSS|nr:sugar phosphate isomerase/epimerase family protein [Sediminispirochaeta smaragdinae]ADK79884.1 Xylose isomerase domain protein TIM barrel [Sediminispirochaeta smaragdinae DSM 11293]
MKLGYNEATCMKRSTVENDLVLCERYGYEYIELRLDMLKKYLEKNTLADLQSFFRSSRLKPYAFNSIENINFCSADQWDTLISLFTFGCEIAQAIGNPYLIVVPTMGDDMHKKSKDDVYSDSVEVLNKLADIAKPYKVKLAFEPIGDKRWCVRSLEQALEIVHAVDRPDVGVALDSINLFLYNRLSNIDSIDDVPLDKLFVYHVNDCEDLPLGVLDHCHRLYPGDGIIPLAKISDKLHKKGYEEICSVELFRPEYWELDPEKVIRTASQKAQRFL